MNRKELPLLSGFLILISCATVSAGSGPQSDWCFSELPSQSLQFEKVQDYRVYSLVPGAIPKGRQLLSERTSREITESRARSFAQVDVGEFEGRFYLIRSGVFGTPSATFEELSESARSVRFDAFLAPETS